MSKKPTKDELYKAATREWEADYEAYLDEWAKQIRESFTADQKEELERLDLDEDLARLEKLTGQFNIFEAVGMVRQEIRHSNFLAWLLNPSHNHGLGDSFLRAFLMRTSAKTSEGCTERRLPADVREWDLSKTEIHRERKYIDITVLNRSINFVCVIENKVDSGERINQLRDYRATVEKEFPDYTRHYVLLNKSGEPPSDSAYVGITYDEVCDVIERASDSRAPAPNDDVATALTHYVAMVRRHILPDGEIQELSRRIYRKHRTALDLIYEHRPDLQRKIRDVLVEIIDADPAFTRPENLTHKNLVRCYPTSWKGKPDLLKAKGGGSDMMVFFSFIISNPEMPNALWLKLTLRRGDDDDVRRKLWDAAVAAGTPFTTDRDKYSDDWPGLFWKEIISVAEWEDLEESLDSERIRSRLQEVWTGLNSNELPQMIDTIEKTFPSRSTPP